MAKKDIETIFKDYNPKPRISFPGQYRMRCFFEENHTDGTGRNSMFISEDENWYHCFSCQSSGTLVHALTSRLGLSAFDAIDSVNISVNEGDFEDYNKVNAAHGDSLTSFDGIIPTKPPQYYVDRGFSPEQLKEFKVGEMLKKSPLEIKKSLPPKPTIHIPFIQGGNVCGVQFIRIKKDGLKEIWSTDFDKTGFLYGEDLVDPKTEEITIVEGFTDVWSTHYKGYAVVGLLGTEFTKHHKNRLAKKFPNLKKVYIATDNDDPGFIAKEIIHFYLKFDYEVNFIVYPGEDPDDCDLDSWEESYYSALDYLSYSMGMYENIDNYEEIKEKSKRKLISRGFKKVHL